MRQFALFLCLVSSIAHADFERQKFTSVPPEKTFQTYFLTRPEINDVQFTYSTSERIAFGLHGVRNHWPKELELHFGFARLNARLIDSRGDNSSFQTIVLTGAGFGNKLNGINRFAYLGGIENIYESGTIYFSLSGWTIGARDYDQKYFVQGRGGFHAYKPETNSLQTLFLLHALGENYAAHGVEWGPIMRLTYKNVMTEFFGTFKGAFSWAFAFQL